MKNATPNLSHPLAFNAEGKRVQDVYVVLSGNGGSVHLAFVSDPSKTFCGRNSSYVSNVGFLIQGCQKCIKTAIKNNITRVTDSDGTVIDIQGETPVATETQFEKIETEGVRVATSKAKKEDDSPSEFDLGVVERLIEEVGFTVEVKDNVTTNVRTMTANNSDIKESVIVLKKDGVVVKAVTPSAATGTMLSRYGRVAFQYEGKNGVGIGIRISFPAHKSEILAIHLIP